MRNKPGWRPRVLLLASVAAVTLGCTAQQRAQARGPGGADRAALQRSMAALLTKIQRATRTIEAVVEARSSILDLVTDAPAGGGGPEPPIDDAEKLARVRGELAEVRSKLQAQRFHFTPEALELRQREDDLAHRERELQAVSRPRRW